MTRFADDPVRIEKRLQESTDIGLYHLNTPGQGLDVPFLEDRQIRLQKWGANLRNNTVDLESDFRGMTRKLGKDDIDYRAKTPSTSAEMYSSAPAFVNDTRVSQPAWMLRDTESLRFHILLRDAQEKTEIPFSNRVSTRYESKKIESTK